MRLIGQMVVKNEAGRYLKRSLQALLAICDNVFVHDDRSTDRSPEIAASLGAMVSVRPLGNPSFADDESAFREEAWRMLVGDAESFVLSLDADEELVARGGDVRQVLEENVSAMLADGFTSLVFPVREVFEFQGKRPLVRTDGFWGDIEARRLASWRRDPRFVRCVEGGGSLPYIENDRMLKAVGLDLMHYGYVREEDRLVKQRRYAGGAHSPVHVASITCSGVLREWEVGNLMVDD